MDNRHRAGKWSRQMARGRFLNQKLGKRTSQRQALMKLKAKTKPRPLKLPQPKAEQG